MDLLLASLLLMWGNVSGSQPTVTMDQLVQASMAEKQAIINQASAQSEASDPGVKNGAGAGEEAAVPDDPAFVKTDPQSNAPTVRGIYVTAYTAGSKSRMDRLIQLLDDTSLNTMVIDIKDDSGNITFDSRDPRLVAMGTTTHIIPDLPALMQTLQAHHVYPIARIVTFKDTRLAKKQPAWSFRNPDGSLWKNGKGDSFVNPYEREVWDYNVEIAKQAAALGFKEIQFDYVRFAEGFETRADKLNYVKDSRSRIQVVSDFVKYAREQLDPLGVRVSVDIFGYSASVPAAEGIGQDFNAISKYVDVISPMVYPSHYGNGWFKQDVPDAHPYATISGAMTDTKKKLQAIPRWQPIIRPWIQDFTATWVKGHIPYGKAEVEAQIQALSDNGIHQYLLWDAGNRYTPGVVYK